MGVNPVRIGCRKRSLEEYRGKKEGAMGDREDLFTKRPPVYIEKPPLSIKKVKQLVGIYAFTFHGLAHVQDINSLEYHGPLWDRLKMGLKDTPPVRDPFSPPIPDSEKAELLVLTAF
jgi:hypothetical protein